MSEFEKEFKWIEKESVVKETRIAEQHHHLNRYDNVLPFDDNLVLDHYINASFVNNNIVTQWPLEHTIQDFWEMIWVHHIEAIVVLTHTERNIVYWPTKNKDIVGKYHVEWIDKQLKKDMIVNLVLLNKERYVYHIQYTAWPDFGCPTNMKTLIKLINMVAPYKKCIHCTAGVGRSGTFMTIDQCIKNHTNVKETILQLRTQRMGMVQTKEQLAFCYEALKYIK